MNKIIISAIKDKKELRSLDDSYVENVLVKYFSQNKKLEKKLLEKELNPKSKEFKETIKEVRAKLREVYGVFQKEDAHKREELLHFYSLAKGKGEKLKQLDSLLRTHQSTYERVNAYPTLFKELFKDLDSVENILDLGCGFNPLAYRWLGCEPKYTASDISSQDMTLLQEFFDFEEIEGETKKCNLLNEEERTELFAGNWDVVFMFKLVDTLESQQRHISKKIITELREKCSCIIISFPMVSIGGRVFREGEKENWFSAFLRKEHITWRIHNIPGEEFWILRSTNLE